MSTRNIYLGVKAAGA